MTEMSDTEWHQWLQELDVVNECSFDFGVGAPEFDLDEADLLQLLAASPNETDGNPTTEHIPGTSDGQRLPGADLKAHYPLEQSIDDVHRLVQKLQHDLQAQMKTLERLATYVAQLQPWTIEISSHLQRLMTKDEPGSAITSPLECLWPQEASKPNSQPSG